MNNVLALKNTKLNRDDINIIAYLDLDLISREDLIVNDEKLLIIIPNDISIKNKLKEKFYVEFDDFCIEDYYDKKIAILYGNCHLENLAECLKNHKPFLDEYVIYPITPIYRVKDDSYFEDPIFKNCDLLIHQSIRKNNRYGEKFASENVIKSLKKSCKVIAVPNVYHLPMCYFPQYTEEQELKHRIGHTMFFRDKIIDEQFKKGVNIRKIVKAYSSTDNGITEEEVEKSWFSFLEKLELREKDWDIKVLDFIKENKSEPLFFDPNHPRLILIKHFAKELCMILNIDSNQIDDIEISNMDTFEMPICNSVISYFDMNISVSKFFLRNTGNKVININMGIREYVYQYISYLWQDKSYPKLIRLKSYLLYLIYFVFRNSIMKIKRR